MICPGAPKLSLTDSDTLSRNGRHLALAGRTWYDGSTPHVSRSAGTNDPNGSMRSRGKRVCHPGGFDVYMMWHNDLTSDGNIWHNVELVRPLPAAAEGYYRVMVHTTVKLRQHSGW